MRSMRRCRSLCAKRTSAEEILAAHSERLDKIAGFLMENENMNRTQFEAIMQDESLDASES